MHIKSIELKNFRNIENQIINPIKKTNILIGDNAQGKTNFLESIYFSAIGRSHRTAREKDMINLDSSACYINSYIESKFSNSNINIELNNKGRKIKINNHPIKKLGELYGHLYIVMFSPEDLSLVKQGPAIRRKFLDMELCQIYPKYYSSLQNYYRILKQRNELLKNINKYKKNLQTLDIWDEHLYFYAKIIIEYRQNFIIELSSIAKNFQFLISNKKEDLEIIYKKSIEIENFLEKLKKSRDYDILKGQTSIGVHKDDIQFNINKKDAKFFASQGQQRSISLSLKISSVEFIKKEKSDSPVLLLDDVFSELDIERQKYLINDLTDIQIFITTASQSKNNQELFKTNKDIKIFEILNGKIK